MPSGVGLFRRPGSTSRSGPLEVLRAREGRRVGDGAFVTLSAQRRTHIYRQARDADQSDHHEDGQRQDLTFGTRPSIPGRTGQLVHGALGSILSSVVALMQKPAEEHCGTSS